MVRFIIDDENLIDIPVINLHSTMVRFIIREFELFLGIEKKFTFHYG